MKDGGPAFPSRAGEYEGGHTRWGVSGMTLRDYFAAKAMMGLVHHMDAWQVIDSHQKAAEAAYRYADAMLRAREA